MPEKKLQRNIQYLDFFYPGVVQNMGHDTLSFLQGNEHNVCYFAFQYKKPGMVYIFPKFLVLSNYI